MNNHEKIIWLVVLVLMAAIVSFAVYDNSVAARFPEAQHSVYSSQPTPTQERVREAPFIPSHSQFLVTGIITGTPQDLAQAMGIQPSDVISASLNGSDPRGVGIGTRPLGNFFPTEGNSFAILSTGLAASADAPNNLGNLSFELDGLNNSQGNDLVQLALRLQVPQDMNCANFDFAFFSEEFPEFVGSIYNDTFTAELGGTNLTISGNQVIAPLNFAFDTKGNIISINTVFNVISDTATTYDGMTSLLRAQTPVTPGATIDIVFSVQDLGDSIYDSAVFLDKFFWSNDPYCGRGAQEDTDGDGLLDIWETKGITVTVNGVNVFVDLPAMGADPNRKDIFVEIDYMESPGFCLPIIGCLFGHSHRPKPEAIAKVVEAFANAPVPNPDGSTGITLHVDFGPDSVMNPRTGERWGSLSQSNSLPHDDNLGFITPSGDYDWTEFDNLKKANFSLARAGIFHYCIFAHNLGGSTAGGISRGIPASDFIVSLGSWTNGVGTTNEQAGAFMHELGHNLGLYHGGGDTVNYKPNYLSIMNYLFAMRGLRINGQDGHFDYSRFALPDLDETNLNETVGLKGGDAIKNYGTRYHCPSGENKIVKNRIVDNANGPIDWNCNDNSTETGVKADINKDYETSALKSYNDWANLVFTGGAIGQPGAEPELPIETEIDEITPEEDALLLTPYKVAVAASGNAASSPGSSVVYTFTVSNLGIHTDTYTINVSSSQGWANLSSVPTFIELPAGASIDFQITVNIPATASPDATDELVLSAISQANPLVEDSAYARTSVLRQIFLPLIMR